MLTPYIFKYKISLYTYSEQIKNSILNIKLVNIIIL